MALPTPSVLVPGWVRNPMSYLDQPAQMGLGTWRGFTPHASDQPQYLDTAPGGPAVDNKSDGKIDLGDGAPTINVSTGNQLSNAQKAQAIASEARRIGANPIDLARIISYETLGTFDPGIRGGSGNRHEGLIQFGPAERRTYGVTRDQDFTSQLRSATRYLQDRGFQPGMGLAEMYSIVNAGSLDANGQPRWNRSDGNGTVRQHVARMQSGEYDTGPVQNIAAEPVPMPRLRPSQTATMEQRFSDAFRPPPTLASYQDSGNPFSYAAQPSAMPAGAAANNLASGREPQPAYTPPFTSQDMLRAAQSGSLPVPAIPTGSGRAIMDTVNQAGARSMDNARMAAGTGGSSGLSGSVAPDYLAAARANLVRAQSQNYPSFSLSDLMTLPGRNNSLDRSTFNYQSPVTQGQRGGNIFEAYGQSGRAPENIQMADNSRSSDNMAGRFTDAFALSPSLNVRAQPARVTTTSIPPPVGGFEPPTVTRRRAGDAGVGSIPTVAPAYDPLAEMMGQVPGLAPAQRVPMPRLRPTAAAPVRAAMPRAPGVPKVAPQQARAVAQRIIQQAPQMVQHIMANGVGVSGGNTDRAGYTFSPSNVSAGGQSYSPMGGSTIVSPSGTIMSPSEYIDAMNSGRL